MAILPLTPTDPSNIKGFSVLITGGASGLGFHAATFFAKSGAFVTIADVQDGSKLATDLVNQGHRAQFVRCDVTDWDSQVKAFQTALAFSPTKTLDMVAAYAGIDNTGHLVDHIAAAEVLLEGAPPSIPSLAPIEVNLKGVFYTATLALHYFRLKPQGIITPDNNKAQASKSLVIISSMAGYIDDTHSTAYTASKFGSRGLFRALRAKAHQQLNVRVNAICPWAMKTPMIEAGLARMAELGILPSKGITLVDHNVLTQALARVTVDESISGMGFVSSSIINIFLHR
jgi:5'-hydroxyaverantin dehydrogenase